VVREQPLGTKSFGLSLGDSQEKDHWRWRIKGVTGIVSVYVTNIMFVELC